MPVVFKPNGNWDRAFNSPGGMVGRHLRSEAKKVERVAKVYVGSKPGATGTLKRSIKAGVPVPYPGGLVIEVKASANHALVHHEGVNRPYVIRPKSKKALSFEVAGKRVIKVGGKRKLGSKRVTVSHVMHPAMPANKYLTRALRTVMRSARGMP